MKDRPYIFHPCALLIILLHIFAPLSGHEFELSYDDGDPEYVYWKTGANSGNSVKFTPPEYPVLLKKAKVYIPASGDNPYAQFAVRVLDDLRKRTNIPDTSISAQTVPGWVEVDFSQHKFVIAKGDFYVSMIWLEADNPRLGADATPPLDGRSYSSAVPGSWNWPEVEEDLMIRAVVTDIVPPSALIAQSNHDEEIRLSWQEPGSAEIPPGILLRSGSMHTNMKPSRSEPTGYNVYRKTGVDDEFTKIGFTSSNRYVDTDVMNGRRYYYVVTSVYSDGESLFSQEASAVPDSGHCVVFFVDDDDAWYSAGTLWGLHQLLENALYRNNTPYVYWDYYNRGSPALDTLNQYPKVVWTTSITGPHVGGTTLLNVDIKNLEDYLRLGGKLFISGMDIGSEIKKSSLFKNYFAAAFASSDAGEGYAGGVTGVPGDPITDGMTLKWGPGDGYWFSDSEFPDVVDPANDSASVIFTYTNNGTNAGLRKSTPNYSVVYLPWNFEAIDGNSNRTLLMKRIVDWLDSTAVDSTSPAVTLGPNAIIEGTNITFEWSTSELTRSILAYGDTIPYSSSLETNIYGLDHSVQVRNLERNQTYHFAITSIDRSGNSSRTKDSTFVPQNNAPERFNLVYPANNTNIQITRYNAWTDTLFFAWNESKDKDGDHVTYTVRYVLPDGGILFNFGGITTNIYGIPYNHIENYLHTAGIEVATGTWTVAASDGFTVTEARNGPFALTVDASAVTIDDSDHLPKAFKLYQNYPNPFNPATTIRYELPEQASVILTIHDIMGRQVRTLVNGSQEPGFKSVLWDGADDSGKPVGAGVYLYRIKAGGFIQIRKMVLLN